MARMTREEIVMEVERHREFFAGKWADFCRWVENCAENLYRYRGSRLREKRDAIAAELQTIRDSMREEGERAEKKRPPVRSEGDIVTLADGCTVLGHRLVPVKQSPEDRAIAMKWAAIADPIRSRLKDANCKVLHLLSRLEAKGWIWWRGGLPLDGDWGGSYPTTGLVLPQEKDKPFAIGSGSDRRYIHGLNGFYGPPRIVNPVLWLLGYNNPRAACSKEQFLLDCALLVILHDASVGSTRRIYHRGTYQGRRFDCDWVCDRLPYRLKEMERKGQFRMAWEALKRYLEQAEEREGEATKKAGRYVFKREGATWRIVYGEHETTVEDSKGVKYIHYVLSHRGVVTESLEIERACSDEDKVDRPLADESASLADDLHGAELDLSRLDRGDFSLATVKAQKAVWERDLERATDPSEQADLRESIAALGKYISHNQNIHGRARPSGPLEKARKRVSMAINTAKRNISKVDNTDGKVIGQHFEAAVRARGSAFIYEPDRDLDWSLS